MRRADRLFEIIQNLRGDRVVTASALAERFEVSKRTIYRDIRDLQVAGVPIDGEAGVGYLLRPGFQLPPLMFTLAEIEALIVGARMAQSWAGSTLAANAAEALIKIGAVVPPERMRAAEHVAVFAPGFVVPDEVRRRFDLLVEAIGAGERVSFAYSDEHGNGSDRTVRPLGLHFWGGTWTLAAWCELRADFRTFRLDRMDALSGTGETIAPETGRTLEAYLAKVTRAG